ncbi:hypothetical protein [Micromonospora sp. IBHARD004]|uniref:hypothetical protein n=1 Tax=Micromonospora sp. IBHARD004 TaxID=3457764 RepID=UPI004058EB97
MPLKPVSGMEPLPVDSPDYVAALVELLERPGADTRALAIISLSSLARDLNGSGRIRNSSSPGCWIGSTLGSPTSATSHPMACRAAAS